MALVDEIRQTIKYARDFGGKLTLEQLHTRLLSNKIYSKSEITKKVTSYKLRHACRQAGVTNNRINQENNYKIKLAKILVEEHLLKFRNILFVAITGSVAAENSRKDEDIDIFIICKANTMWLTRLCLRLYIKINNIPHRRFGYQEKPNDFCFNLWIDENDLTVLKSKQNEKNAVDIVMMKVIYNQNFTYEKFIASNKWVSKYVANGYKQLRVNSFKLRVLKNKTGIIVGGLNFVSYIGQLLYIRLKGPIKNINLTQAYFHK